MYIYIYIYNKHHLLATRFFSPRQFTICSDSSWLGRFQFRNCIVTFDERSTFQKMVGGLLNMYPINWQPVSVAVTVPLANSLALRMEYRKKRKKEKREINRLLFHMLCSDHSTVYHFQYANDANDYTYVSNECKFIRRLIQISKTVKHTPTEIFTTWTRFLWSAVFSTNIY